MLRALYTAATGMDAQQTKLDVIANNLANSGTTGFKRVRADFEDLLSETVRSATSPTPQGGGRPEPLQVGLGVRTATTTRSFSQGDVNETKNSLDIAIEGNGFFRIQRANGDFAYTRAGNLRQDATCRLVTQTGEIVDPAITFPSDTTSITIRADGTVLAAVPGKTDPVEVGSFHLAMFTNPGGLDALGTNLYGATVASGDPTLVKPGEQGSGSLSQGYLEGANVQVVQEMVDLITTQRAYEMNSKTIQTADAMLQKLTQLH